MKPILIRDASPDDAPALSRLMVRAYAQAFADILDAAALASRNADFFEERFYREWPMMRLAETETRDTLGLTLVRLGHIDMIFVEPAAIGRGVGAALLRDAEARGAKSLECFAANRSARRFYERMGWRLDKSYRRDFAGAAHDFVTYIRLLSR
ncbi:MAG: GNAT family N-acetyltransferase [Beijerinckiaceae bacterium]